MAVVDILLWTLAVALFVGGDWLTTRAGLAKAGVRETNPIARAVIARLGVHAGLVLLKTVALAVGFGGYLYARAGNWPHPELFPLVFLLAGLLVTLSNLWVLARANRRE